MGSFSSKMLVSSSQSTENDRKLSKRDANPSGTAGNLKSQARSEATNEDKARAGSTNQEQPSVAKKRPSFSWLVETPVVLHTSSKEQDDKGKKAAADGKGKVNNVGLQSDDKYLKSVELPSTSNGKSKRVHYQDNPTSCSSEKQGKYESNNSWNIEGIMAKSTYQMNQNPRSNDDATASYPVGFGVVGKNDSRVGSRATK